METKANHVLIGAFTLAVAIAALLFSLWAAKYSTEKSWNEYDVIFKEAVTGLSVGGLVQYNGITVGSVRTLKLGANDPRRVIARIRVQADTPVKVDTRATLGFTGLTGVAFIQMSGGSPRSPYLQPAPGKEIAAINADTSALQKLLSSGEDLTTTASDILSRVSRMLSDENAQRVTQTLANLEAATGAIAAERDSITALLQSARAAAADLQTVMAKADRTIGRIDATVADDLPRLVGNLDKTLAQLESFTRNADALVAENRGAITRFSNHGLGQVGPTLHQLRATLRDLNQMMEKLDNNPAAFVLGRDRLEEFDPEQRRTK